ncbi:MAG TPA: SHOCT domain-containing protein [Acidimicrobiales bacterium]
MVLAAFGSGQVLWDIFWLFLFVLWFWLLIMVFSDLFRDHAQSGWAKAAWCIFLIIAPYLGIFVYLIARGGGMTQRAVAAQQAQQQQFDSYVKETAGGGDAADQIARAKALLDQGAITSDEFDQIKRKALA